MSTGPRKTESAMELRRGAVAKNAAKPAVAPPATSAATFAAAPGVKTTVTSAVTPTTTNAATFAEAPTMTNAAEFAAEFTTDDHRGAIGIQSDIIQTISWTQDEATYSTGSQPIDVKLARSLDEVRQPSHANDDVSVRLASLERMFAAIMSRLPLQSSSNMQTADANDTATTSNNCSNANVFDRQVVATDARSNPGLQTSNVQPLRGNPRKLLELPEFAGEPERWPLLYTAYEESTRQYDYNPFENCQRLQKCLKGEAYEAVKSLLILPHNTNVVMQQLKSRFGRPEHLISSQLREIQSVPSISEAAIDKLVSFATKVKNVTAFLQSINANHHLSNPTMLNELVEKLPLSKRLEWARVAVNIKPYATIEHFSQWIDDLAVAVNALPQHSQRETKRTVMHLNADTKQECFICQGPHRVYKCPKFIGWDIDRRWAEVKKRKLCFCRLNCGHASRNCRRSRPCGRNNCKRTHNILLHGETPNTPTTLVSRTDVPPTIQPILSCTSPSPTHSLFCVLPVHVHGPKGTIEAYALLDNGSSVTLVDKLLCDHLGIHGERSNLALQWISGRSSDEVASVVTISISGVGMHERYTMSNVYALKNLRLPTQSLAASVVQKHAPKVQPYHNAKPLLLIGLDNCRLSNATETIKVNENGTFASNTKLGWVAFGPTSTSTTYQPRCLLINEMDEALHNTVVEYLALENFGVRAAPAVESEEDTRAREILKRTTKRVEGRYQTGLLWKDDEIMMPDSYAMAKRRLHNMEQKMQHDAVFQSAYKSAVHAYIEKGYARKLEIDKICIADPRCWYLPHFAVINKNKPNKLRLVFDAAAAVDSVALNSALLKGPQDYQPLPTVLFNFRIGKVAVCGDIREMFHQILIQPSDRCAQRFLWRENSQLSIDVYEMNVMIFGAACSPCSAQYVKNENAKGQSTYNQRAIQSILKYHYVDDFVDSFASPDIALDIAKQVTEIHKKAGFELRGFTSNIREVSDALNNKSKVKSQPDTLEVEKILGMFWHPDSDTLQFKLKLHQAKVLLESGDMPTKRQLLSIVMSVFDPLGFLSHLMIAAKLIVRETWTRGVKWDDVIPTKIQDAWSKWKIQLTDVTQVRVPRCYFMNGSPHQLQLHVFVDASESAFAAVAYWRYTHSENCIETSFVCAKSRCAPMKSTTIPRLELQAAVLGSRLAQTILLEHELNAEQLFMWSDSTTVINWINSKQRRYKPYVAHRVNEILNTTQESSWRWLSTHLNPADEATRPHYNIDLSPTSRWFVGPPFLRRNQSEWPEGTHRSSLADEEAEVLPEYVLSMRGTPLIAYERFSSFFKLVRAQAWVHRFIFNCRRTTDRRTMTIAASEIATAELSLIRQVQADSFEEELSNLRNNKQLPSRSSLIQLMPYIDNNNILRSNGRLKVASWLPLDSRNPIIMPHGHTVTRLLIEQYHQQMKHQNNEATIGEICQRYWIPKLRQQLRTVVNNCRICQMKRAMPQPAVMAPLPPDRIMPYVRPFTYTGLDYFGPLTVTIGRRQEKRWIAIFTCLTIRAIHLEVAADLSTDSCILAIRNFINRRGTPVRIRSDNGKNFVGIANVVTTMDEVFDCNRIKDELAAKRVEWVFNCPCNPAEGGVWERMVRCVKRVLGHTLKEVAPREHTLISLIIEAECIVNSRPLTHLPTTPEEMPLTPNHFLLGCPSTTQTPQLTPDSRLCVRKQWRIARMLKARFWKQWIKEYLPTLTRRVKWCQRSKPIAVGDLVLVCEPDKPGQIWRKGIIERTYPDKDGDVRRAEVRTAKGTIQRPVSKLAVIDRDGEPVGSRGGGC